MGTTGENIRIRRLTMNYSQTYMAFMLEISQAAYSNLERDETKLTVERVFEIAEILKISPFELMPKPKSGIAIYLNALWESILKLKRLLFSRSRNKIELGREI